MANEGTLELGLVDVRNNLAYDPEVDVRLFGHTTGRELAVWRNVKFPPRLRIRAPAFPQESHLSVEIVPSRFRIRKAGGIVLTDGETVRRDLTVFRKPEHWHAQFTAWRRLSTGFGPLKRVLRRSSDLVLKSGESLGTFIEGVYDQASGEPERLAKAALLNLYTKLRRMPVPGDRRDWFSFVEQVLIIDRERFIAVVSEEMAQIIRRIKDDISSFPDYKHTPAENHHDNLPERYRVAKTNMFSIKSQEEKGNVQLTIGPGTDPDSGDPVFLLDTDIDENGKLLHHLADVFKHKFTGGTHPFDILEYLLLTYPKANVGYSLV